MGGADRVVDVSECRTFWDDATAFAKDGALHLRAALSATDLQGLEDAIAGFSPDQAGIRLHGIPALRPFLVSSGAVGKVAASVLGNAAQAVRAILFDKTASTNWGLPWHQDRTIAVAERIEVEGFGPWDRQERIAPCRPTV